jgi:hypothetical protein
MKKLISCLLLSSSLLLNACFPAQKVAKYDANTGMIQLEAGKKLGAATVVKNTKVNLNSFKEMVFFSSNQYYYDYGYKQLSELGYFKSVMKFSDLEKLVISNNLQDKVINLDSQIGLSRLANHYKPFLWITLTPDQENNVQYTKLIVKNPANAEELFEVKTLSSGSTDEQVLYPLFNELSLWIKSNS